MRLVEIEFTEDTFGADGDVKREKGTRMKVDPVSARSFCDVKKVAKRLDGSSPEPAPALVKTTTEQDSEPEPVEGEHESS